MPRYPTYFGCKKLEGACIGLQRMLKPNKLLTKNGRDRDGGKNLEARIAVVAAQLSEGLCILREEAKKVKGWGDKIRFAEGIIAAFDPGNPDTKVWRACWRATEMRTRRENPSQFELRHAVEQKDGIKFSDQEWKRLIKRTGLNKQLPTHRQKTQGIRLGKI